MSKYAKIENNLVVNVFLCNDSEILNIPGYNVKVTQESGNAIIGGTYDLSLNKFIAPKPFESWVLNENFEWESPAGPNPDILTKTWDEESQSWINR